MPEALKILETRFECRFSYADELLTGIFVAVPGDTENLEDALASLQRQSGLQFNILSNRIITIFDEGPILEEICGKVFRADNTPLAGAVIRYGSRALTTDAMGAFQLRNLQRRDTLSVSYMGYKTQEFPLSEMEISDCIQVTLQEEVQVLEEVTISNFLTRGINIERSGNLLLNAKEFGLLPGLTNADPLQIIQTLPGINSNDETVTNINIRGGTHDQNLIAWNGIRMYQSGHFFNYISAFNPDLVAQTRFIKNGTPAALGEGVSGSILMNSSDEVAKSTEGSVGMNLINANANFVIPVGKKASVQLSGRRSLNELLRSQAYQNYFKQAFQDTEIFSDRSNVIEASDAFRFYDFGAVFNYHITPDNKLKAGMIVMDNSFSFLENAFVNNTEQSRQSSSTQENKGAFLQYKKRLSHRAAINANTYWVRYDLQGKNADILNDQLFVQNNRVDEFGVKLMVSKSFNPSVTLTSGYEMVHTRVSNTSEIFGISLANREDQDLVDHALFSQVTLLPWEGGVVSPGLRINYLPQLDILLPAPRLHFSQTVGKNATVYLSGEMKNQAIAQEVDLQTDFLGVENRRWFLADESQRPVMKSQQLSLGYMLKNDSWNFLMEAYTKKVRGIWAKGQEFRNDFEGVDAIGDYRVEGVDLTLNRQTERLSGWLSYSIANNRYDFPVLYPDEFPGTYNIRHVVTSGITYTLAGFTGSLGYNWRTGQPFTMPVPGNEVVDEQINYLPPNSSELSQYSRLDGSLMYRFSFSGKMEARMGGSVWNILNRSNEISSYYRFTDINFPDEVMQYGLERTINLFMQINF